MLNQPPQLFPVPGSYREATAENARLAVLSVADRLPRPRFTLVDLQARIAHRSDNLGLWDFVSVYETYDPVYDPENGRLVLEFANDKWRLQSAEDFEYIHGTQKA